MIDNDNKRQTKTTIKDGGLYDADNNLLFLLKKPGEGRYNGHQLMLLKKAYPPNNPHIKPIKTSTYTKNKEIRNVLIDHKWTLISKAVKMAVNGNVPVMCKLLDKLLPNLSDNKTTIEGQITFEAFVREQVKQIAVNTQVAQADDAEIIAESPGDGNEGGGGL